MITKGIVEEILTNYSIKVRLPILDSIEGTRDATPTSDLSEAIVCVAPNSEINFTVGDIVIVGFEDNDDSKPIILGFLFKESGNTSSISNNLSKLNVNVSAKLPRDTSIGNISSQDISMLQGAKFNIQSQLNNSNASINELEKVVDDLSKSVEVDISKLMPKTGGVFTGEVKFNEVDGNCINFDNGIYINKKNGSTLIGTNSINAWVGTPDTALTMRGNGVRPTYNNNPLALLNDMPKSESIWEQVGRFTLSSNTEFWYNQYDFDFTNYDYKLEGRLITVSGNSRSVFAFVNSSGNWITYPVRWVQLRGSSTTSGGASLNTDGYAVAESQNYI